MADLKKITTGMANGCAAIDENFTALNDELTTSTSANVDVGNGMNIKITKKGKIIEVRFYGTMTAINNGAEMGGTGSSQIPSEFRPGVTASLIGHFASSTESFHIDIEPTGRVVWWGAAITGTGKAPRGTAVYFLK